MPFTRRTLRSICGKIYREQAQDDVRKTLEVFADIVAGDPGFTYRVLVDSTSKVKNLMWTNGSSRLQYPGSENEYPEVCVYLSLKRILKPSYVPFFLVIATPKWAD